MSTSGVEDGDSEHVAGDHQEDDDDKLGRDRKRRCSSAYIESLNITDVKQYFGLPLKEAAEQLNLSGNTLKRVCRAFGIPKWPFRDIVRLKRGIKHVQHLIGNATDEVERQQLQATLHKMMVQEEVLHNKGALPQHETLLVEGERDGKDSDRDELFGAGPPSPVPLPLSLAHVHPASEDLRTVPGASLTQSYLGAGSHPYHHQHHQQHQALSLQPQPPPQLHHHQQQQPQQQQQQLQQQPQQQHQTAASPLARMPFHLAPPPPPSQQQQLQQQQPAQRQEHQLHHTHGSLQHRPSVHAPPMPMRYPRPNPQAVMLRHSGGHGHGSAHISPTTYSPTGLDLRADTNLGQYLLSRVEHLHEIYAQLEHRVAALEMMVNRMHSPPEYGSEAALTGLFTRK